MAISKTPRESDLEKKGEGQGRNSNRPSARGPASDIHLDLIKGQHLKTKDGEKAAQTSSRHAKKQPPQSEEERTFLTGQAQQRVPLPPPSAADKSRTPEAPPPTTEGGARRRSPQKLPTPNPLRGGFDLGVSEDVVSNLRQTFQRLDTDMDGHLQYHQLKSQLPAEFSQQQEDFVRQVYELTSSGAFFGVDEFMMMTQLTNRVAALSGPALEAYGKIDFKTLEAAIIRYVDLFQESDSSQKGRITMDSLRELVGKSQNKPALEESSSEWNTILDSLRPEYQSEVSRTEYLAHIPLLMSLAPLPQEDLNPQQPEEQLQGEK